jgi:hypothetical protein
MTVFDVSTFLMFLDTEVDIHPGLTEPWEGRFPRFKKTGR